MAVWSEVLLSSLPGERRMDAEFWQPRYIENVEAVTAHPHTTLGDLVTTFRKGVFYILASDYAVSGVPFYRSANVQGVMPRDSGLAFISPERDEIERKTSLRRGDLMLAKTGKNGASVVLCDRCNVSQDVIAVKLKKDLVNPFFLAVYLNTTPGGLELRRWFQGQVQEHLSLLDAKRVLVPLLSDEVQSAAQEAVERAEASLRDAEGSYADAEVLLKSALGLDVLDLAPRLFYERPYVDIQAAARFDAEYFQPSKQAVLDALAKMPGQAVSDQYRSVRQLWQPDQAGSSDQVRNYDLNDALHPFLDGTVEPATRDTIASTKKELKPGDLVVSRLRSYLKEIALVLDAGPIPMVGSTEFIVLRPRKGAVAVEALLVYLRCKYVQTVLKWCQDGSNHPRFHEGELLSLRIPDVLRDHQDDIVAKVQASNNARREARRLLDEAKSIVEQAIWGDR